MCWSNPKIHIENTTLHTFLDRKRDFTHTAKRVFNFCCNQVADGDADHSWWGRPEDNYQHRPTFTIGAGKPAGGADIMGETAAAMAAGYVVFKKFGKHR